MILMVAQKRELVCIIPSKAGIDFYLLPFGLKGVSHKAYCQQYFQDQFNICDDEACFKGHDMGCILLEDTAVSSHLATLHYKGV